MTNTILFSALLVIGSSLSALGVEIEVDKTGKVSLNGRPIQVPIGADAPSILKETSGAEPKKITEGHKGVHYFFKSLGILVWRKNDNINKACSLILPCAKLPDFAEIQFSGGLSIDGQRIDFSKLDKPNKQNLSKLLAQLPKRKLDGFDVRGTLGNTEIWFHINEAGELRDIMIMVHSE